MSMSPEAGRRLKAFRLADVPLELRERAVRSVAMSSTHAAGAEIKPADHLFSRLLADRAAGGDTGDVEVLRKVAREPSERVYWISKAAWDRVIGGPP